MSTRRYSLLLIAFAIFFFITAPITCVADSWQEQVPHQFGAGQGHAPAGPQAMFPEPLFDAGTLEAGAEFTHTFKVKNVGKADLLIEQVKPS